MAEQRRITMEDALEYAARVLPDLFFDVLAGMPEPIQEHTIKLLREREALRIKEESPDG